MNEVQRETLAMAGLGMKRSSRRARRRQRQEQYGPASGGTALDDQLQAFVGMAKGWATRGQDPVNLPMIRHWVEAMGDHNPVYVDDDVDVTPGFLGIIAPPTMLQAWIMRGLRASLESDGARSAGEVSADSPSDNLMGLLDEAGFTSVVATNCDQHYVRRLVPGHHLEASSIIDEVSGEKATGLGARPLHHHPPGVHLMKTANWWPPCGSGSSSSSRDRRRRPANHHRMPLTRPKRPRPALTQDNSFFFEGVEAARSSPSSGCMNAGTLRHPPRPSVPNCRSFEWDAAHRLGPGGRSTASWLTIIPRSPPSTTRWWWRWSSPR